MPAADPINLLVIDQVAKGQDNNTVLRKQHAAVAAGFDSRRGAFGFRLSSPRFSPRGEIDQRLLVGRGIEPENAAAGLHLFGDEILERGHLEGFVGDLLGEMRGDHDHAVAVAEDDVAGKHRRVAAADRAS